MPRYPLDNVTIEGFRGIRDLSLDNLGLINLLVGPNNSGKTSVLEALSILCNPEDPYEWLRVVQRREPGASRETRIHSLRWCFLQGHQPAEQEVPFKGTCTFLRYGSTALLTLRAIYTDIDGDPVGCAGSFSDRDVSPQGRRGALEPGPEPAPRRGAKITHRIEFGDPRLFRARDRVQPVVVHLWDGDPIPPDHLLPFQDPVSVQTLTPSSWQTDPGHVRSLSPLLLGRDRSAVLELIREFDHEVSDIREVRSGGEAPEIHLVHERLGAAPITAFGGGLVRAVLLAGTILSLREGGILLIDEVETGIHESSMARLFRWVARVSRQMNVQIVATTHSLEVVDAMAYAAADGQTDLVIFHLDQTDRQNIVKRINMDLLSRLRRERALDVR
jgi:energy-coupling factor transporter ATP-binding protein EcfA2